MNPAFAADGDPTAGVTFLCFLVLVYFIPARAAFNRKHHNKSAIFPANVDVAAALALAGIEPDHTIVKIWADPAATRNIHRIDVEADAARFSMQIENVPSDDNPRIGRLRALAVIAIIAASALACSLPLAVHADPVTWTFYETSCTSELSAQPGDCSPAAPLDLVDLTLPYPGAPAGADNLWLGDPEGMIMSNTGTLVGTGWTLTIHNAPGEVRLQPDNAPYLSGAGGLQGGFSGLNIDLFPWPNSFTESEIAIFSNGHGSIASDLQIANCPLDLSCQIAGYWQVFGVPESTSAALLLAALGVWYASRRHGSVSAG